MKRGENEVILYELANPIEHDRDTLRNLRVEIKRHNHLYYNAEPELTDDEYDCLYRYLQRLEAKFPDMFDPNSPTQTVGASV
jgi:DNA ligase (NAD+)